MKKTRDAAPNIFVAAYGSAPGKSYFLVSSTGGREALTVAGRWPADWDGVVSLYPARSVVALLLNFIASSRTLSAPGAYLSLGKRAALHQAAFAACDSLDGLADGIISNVTACNVIVRSRPSLTTGCFMA